MLLTKLLNELSKEQTTTKQLAERSNVPLSTVYKYLKGESMEKIDRIFDTLTTGVTAEEFINTMQMIKNTKKQIHQKYLDHKKEQGELTENAHKFVSEIIPCTRFNLQTDELTTVKNETVIFYKNNGSQKIKKFPKVLTKKGAFDWAASDNSENEILRIEVTDEHSKTEIIY